MCRRLRRSRTASTAIGKEWPAALVKCEAVPSKEDFRCAWDNYMCCKRISLAIPKGKRKEDICLSTRIGVTLTVVIIQYDTPSNTHTLIKVNALASWRKDAAMAGKYLRSSTFKAASPIFINIRTLRSRATRRPTNHNFVLFSLRHGQHAPTACSGREE